MSNPEVGYEKARQNLRREIAIYGQEIDRYEKQRKRRPANIELIQEEILRRVRLSEVAAILLSNFQTQILRRGNLLDIVKDGVMPIDLTLVQVMEKLSQDASRGLDIGDLWRIITALGVRTGVSYQLRDYKTD